MQALTITLGASIVGPLAEKFGTRPIIVCGSALMSLSLWLAGGLESASEVATWIGLALNGLFVSAPFILTMPEVLESVELSIESEG